MKYEEEVIRREIEEAEAGTRFYFGCDSRRYKNKKNEWWISFATVIVVHIGGKHGCRVYGLVEKERDYSGSMRMRLVREAHKAAEMAMRFEEDLILNDIDFEIHLDINSDPKEGKSNVAMKEAAGYILGVLGVRPLFKPDAWAASHGADAFEYKTGPKKAIPRRKVRRHLKNIHEDEVKRGVADASA